MAKSCRYTATSPDGAVGTVIVDIDGDVPRVVVAAPNADGPGSVGADAAKGNPDFDVDGFLSGLLAQGITLTEQEG